MWQRNNWHRSIDYTIRCAGTVAQEIQEQRCDAESAGVTTYVGRNVNSAPNNCEKWISAGTFLSLAVFLLFNVLAFTLRVLEHLSASSTERCGWRIGCQTLIAQYR